MNPDAVSFRPRRDAAVQRACVCKTLPNKRKEHSALFFSSIISYSFFESHLYLRSWNKTGFHSRNLVYYSLDNGSWLWKGFYCFRTDAVYKTTKRLALPSNWLLLAMGLRENSLLRDSCDIGFSREVWGEICSSGSEFLCNTDRRWEMGKFWKTSWINF